MSHTECTKCGEACLNRICDDCAEFSGNSGELRQVHGEGDYSRISRRKKQERRTKAIRQSEMSEDND